MALKKRKGENYKQCGRKDEQYRGTQNKPIKLIVVDDFPDNPMKTSNKLESRVFYEHFNKLAVLKLLSHAEIKNHIDQTIKSRLVSYIKESDSCDKVDVRKPQSSDDIQDEKDDSGDERNTEDKDGKNNCVAGNLTNMGSEEVRVKKVTYNRTEHGLGRLYGKNSMQMFPHKVCESLGIAAPVLKQYVEEREIILEEVKSTYNVKKEDAKELFIRMMYGGGFKTWASDLAVSKTSQLGIICGFQAEMAKIQDAVWAKYPEHHKVVKEKDLPKGSLVAIVLNIEEDKILEEIVKFEEQQFRRKIDVLTFDGCQIRRDAENPLTEDELAACCDWVFHKTGFRIVLKEKPMDDCLDLKGCKPLFHVICANEAEAAIALREIHGRDLFKYCGGTLYVYDKETGLWNCDEKSIHQQLLGQYHEEMGPWLETVKGWKNLYSMLQTQNGDPRFIERVEMTSLGKLLFRNGYYDFETKTFSRHFDPNLFFPFRIERNYNPSRNETHIKYVNLMLFLLPFQSKETGNFLKQSLSRAIAGCIQDKRIYFGIGVPNAGKGVLTHALQSCYGAYIGTFNGGILQTQGDKDCSLRNKEYYENRWRRIMISNEMPMNKPIDGVFAKVISSGGDKMIGRKLYENGGDFTPHATTFVNGNDRPKITPSDDALFFRMWSICFFNTFDSSEESDAFKDFSQLQFDLGKYIEFYERQYYSETKEAKRLVPDPNIKQRVLEEWFNDALFHLLADSYGKAKSTPPQEVREFTNGWNKGDDFLENFKENFEITESENDIVTNKEIVLWCEQNGFKMSPNKIGLELAKLKGVKKVVKASGANYVGLKFIL